MEWLFSGGIVVAFIIVHCAAWNRGHSYGWRKCWYEYVSKEEPNHD